MMDIYIGLDPNVIFRSIWMQNNVVGTSGNDFLNPNQMALYLNIWNFFANL